MGLLSFRTLTDGVSEEQQNRRRGTPDERKVSRVTGPHRQPHHDSPPTPGSHISPGHPSALSWRREVNYMLKLFVAHSDRLADASQRGGSDDGRVRRRSRRDHGSAHRRPYASLLRCDQQRAQRRHRRCSARRSHCNTEEESATMIESIGSQFQSEEGQTMAEYGVVLGVITLAIVTILLPLVGAIGVALERTLEHRQRRRLPATTDGGRPGARGAHTQHTESRPHTHDQPPKIRADEKGQTMVEFALVLPVLCVLLFGVIQFGILYNDYVTLTDATAPGRARRPSAGTRPTPVGGRRGHGRELRQRPRSRRKLGVDVTRHVGARRGRDRRGDATRTRSTCSASSWRRAT